MKSVYNARNKVGVLFIIHYIIYPSSYALLKHVNVYLLASNIIFCDPLHTLK